MENITATWMINEMNSNHIVNIEWQPDLSVSRLFHASLIKKIEQNIINFQYRYRLMDPASWGGFDFSKIRNIFSVWKK